MMAKESKEQREGGRDDGEEKWSERESGRVTAQGGE